MNTVDPLFAACGRAAALIGLHRFDEARALLKQLLQSNDDGRLWHLLSVAVSRSGDWRGAIEASERAEALGPKLPAHQVQYVLCLIARGERSRAVQALMSLPKPGTADVATDNAAGTLWSMCDEPLAALPYFESAVARAHGNLTAQFNLATALRVVGRIDAATQLLDRLVEAAPDHALAHHMRAHLKTQTPQQNHLLGLRQAVARRQSPQDSIHLSFALAKELEDVGDYRESFEWLKRGCDQQRSTLQYDVNSDIALLRQAIQTVTSASELSPETGHPTVEPVFVIGLPRSGTTLVERILGTHSEIQAAGELPTFPATVQRLCEETVSRNVRGEEALPMASGLDPVRIGSEYLHATRPQTGARARFLDKLPTNYLYAGLIAKSLPGARIIALVRDPMDNCYAMYKTLFTRGYSFSYSLEELGRYYRAWHELMRHWQAVLADRLLVVTYEELVSSQRAVTGRMLAHCGLEWEEACMSFHLRSDPVMTASAVQIRQPLYASSVGRWRCYEQELQPLSALLGDFK